MSSSKARGWLGKGWLTFARQRNSCEAKPSLTAAAPLGTAGDTLRTYSHAVVGCRGVSPPHRRKLASCGAAAKLKPVFFKGGLQGGG